MILLRMRKVRDFYRHWPVKRRRHKETLMAKTVFQANYGRVKMQLTEQKRCRKFHNMHE